jgi:peptide chain release factor 1
MNLGSVLEGDGLEDFLDALRRDHDETTMEDMLHEE